MSSNNKLSNFLINSTVLYGDGLTVDYNNAQNNEIFNGYSYNLHKNHQINGQGTKLYNVIMHKVSKSNLIHSVNRALTINPYINSGTEIINSHIYNNTFIDIEGTSSIQLTATRANRTIKDIKIENNYFYNSKIEEDLPILVYVMNRGLSSDDTELKNINIIDNKMYNTTTPFGILEGSNGEIIKFDVDELNGLDDDEYKGRGNEIYME